MRDTFEKFKRMVSGIVRFVAVHVIFFGAERQGEAGQVSITFADGTRFEFECAGDGSILVILCGKSIQDAPNITTICRRIPEISGQLREAVREGNQIRIKIDETILILTNNDDQMDIVLNGKQPSADFYSRP